MCYFVLRFAYSSITLYFLNIFVTRLRHSHVIYELLSLFIFHTNLHTFSLLSDLCSFYNSVSLLWFLFEKTCLKQFILCYFHIFGMCVIQIKVYVGLSLSTCLKILWPIIFLVYFIITWYFKEALVILVLLDRWGILTTWFCVFYLFSLFYFTFNILFVPLRNKLGLHLTLYSIKYIV